MLPCLREISRRHKTSEPKHQPDALNADIKPTQLGPLIAGGLAGAIALVAFIGWVTGVEELRQLVRGLPSMRPLTACCLIATSLALILLQARNARGRRRAIGKLLAAAVLAVGGVQLIAIWTGVDLDLNRMLFASGLTAEGGSQSRMPVRTALCLSLTSASLLLLDVPTRRGRRPAELLSFIVLVVALLALVGYSYGLIVYYRTATFTPMSLPGAIAFFLLAIGILLARTDAGAMRVLMSDTPAGLFARLLLPLGIFLPLVFGVLRQEGERAGWYSTKLGVALFATVFIIFFLGAVWWTARLLFRSESQRRAAEEQVRRLNAELEQRVNARTAELNLRNEELREASRAKDNFLAVLSHELRTPLTPALAAASYLAEHQDLPPDLREEVTAIRANVQLEARLIDDLLDLTRLTRGKVELHREQVDVHHLLRKTLHLLHEDIVHRELDIATEFAAPDHHVSADPVRLQQVFWNLISNALKFTARGGRVTVKSWNDLGRFVVEISDTGVGIDPEQQSRIFKAFEQGERSITRQFGGLGLGLTITKTLLDLHGGTIAVQSQGKDLGATFTVSLAIAENAAAVLEPAATAHARSAGLQLLLVDDHADTLHVIGRLLRKRGHRVSTADCVQAALKLLSAEQFDALISDIGLPDGNGCDLMREARQQHELRGVAISGFGMDEDVRRSMEAGFERHLTKPVDFGELEKFLGDVAEHAHDRTN